MTHIPRFTSRPQPTALQIARPVTGDTPPRLSDLLSYQMHRLIDWIDGVNPLAALLAVILIAIGSCFALTSEYPNRVPDLFGTSGVRIKNTPYNAKWARAAQPVTHEAALPILMQAQRATNDLQRLQMVQQAVFEQIRYREDRDLYGTEDYWATPNETLRHMAGDCEDVAILKRALLLRLGIAADQMFLTVGYDLAFRTGHAVLVVRLGQRHYVLDESTGSLIDDQKLVDFRPVVTMTSQYSWIHAERSAPILAAK
ncbi:transglutaminase-like cysteine peptidase [Sphingopyxis yananensis]|uniref:transglutaminase-like cysteine peptidase n=1 Tax=Sphingopyxis yananensis TaxID=2886687 RepID=UPI001D0FC06C|nr:transglutaminase-like cysteine peptidase [Sphingopyxis yananensis]MCC2601889.1 transglutaminase-like cysteine peptidase [Sphingopyxis yananensis]